MTAKAGGGAGLLHKITKPRAWRGGAQILKDEEEDAKPLARCEERRKEWAKHWQCDTKVRRVEEFGGGHAEVIGEGAREGSTELLGKDRSDRSGVRWLSSQVPLDLTEATSETLEGRSATFGVQGLVFCFSKFSGLNCCTISCNISPQKIFF